MSFAIEIDREPGGEWVASVRDLGNLVARDVTRDGALRAVQVLALRALAEQLQRGERPPFAAFGVTAIEGPTILGIRSRATQTLRELQTEAARAGVADLSDEEIEIEIRKVRQAQPYRPSSTRPPKNAKDASRR